MPTDDHGVDNENAEEILVTSLSHNLEDIISGRKSNQQPLFSRDNAGKKKDDNDLKIASELLVELGFDSAAVVPTWNDVRDIMKERGLDFLHSNSNEEKSHRVESLHVLSTAVQLEMIRSKQSNRNSLPILPPHLSQSQRQTINACFALLEADYKQRLKGMQQRFRLLKANFGVEEEENETDPSRAQLGAAPLDSQMVELSGLLKTMSAPSTHNRSSDSAKKLEASELAKRKSDNDAVEDRGGRLEPRVTMPAWTDAPRPASSQPPSNSKQGHKRSRNKKKR